MKMSCLLKKANDNNDKRSGVVLPIRCFVVCVCFVLTLPRPAASFNIDVKSRVIHDGANGSYFGYSVSVLDAFDSTRLLVGAPRDSNKYLPTSIKNPGALFQFVRGTRNAIRIDDAVGEETFQYRGGTYHVTHGKDHQWLGASMDVNDRDKSVVVCAPRWHNKRSLNYRDDKFGYHMNGLCYKLSPQSDPAIYNVERIPAIVDRDQRSLYWDTDRGVAGMGMSAHFPKKGNDLLMGAPGLYDWTGGFVDSRPSEDILSSLQFSATGTSEFVGYAITSGKYFADRKTYFAIGSPRYELTGKVLFFGGDETDFAVNRPKKYLDGGESDRKHAQLGNYFGAALCTADVNKDGVDDLLVGAPLYAEKLDEGRVFVYLGKRHGSFFERKFKVPRILHGSNTDNARFGSAITNLGDLNNDGYNDVAVGAPYEDSDGVVYIYNGYYKGLWHKYSQRIAAGSLSQQLRAFGISFSRGHKLNSDNVNDFAVGAYKSDQMVVLFGRPVVNIVTRINTSEKVINYFNCMAKMQLPCFDIKFCATSLNISVARILLSIKVSLNGDRRVSFSGGGIIRPDHGASLTITDNNETCTVPMHVYVLPTRNIISPIKITAEYEDTNIISKFNTPIGPTLNRFNGHHPGDMALRNEKKVFFVNDCPDNICKTDLKLNATLSYNGTEDHFTVGTPKLSIEALVTRTGDPSYVPEFTVKLPQSLEYKRTDSSNDSVHCDVAKESLSVNDVSNDTTYDGNYTLLACSLGRGLEEGSEISFAVSFNVPNNVTDDTFEFVMNVSSLYSEEIDPNDNLVTFTLPVQSEVKSDFSGASRPETIKLNGDEKKKASHVFELRNHGPSILPMSTLSIKFPQVQVENSDKLFLNRSEANCPSPCKVDCGISGKFIGRRIYQSGMTHNTNTKAEIDFKGDVKQLDCRKEPCSQFVCRLHNLPPQQSGVISLNFVIDPSVLKSVSKGKSVKMFSKADVQLNHERLITDKLHFNTSVDTEILPQTAPPEQLPWWIIVASAAGGVLLIAILVVVLWKVGFFKRKVKKELNKRKTLYEEAKRKTMMNAAGNTPEGGIENDGYNT